jgi:hypothetical protein
MSFQAYLDNIKAKTGKTPDDFKKLRQTLVTVSDHLLLPEKNLHTRKVTGSIPASPTTRTTVRVETTVQVGLDV